MATTSTDLNSLPSLSSNIEVHEDLHPNRPQASSSSSSLSSPLLCNPCQDHGGTTLPFQIQQEGDDFVPHDGGSSWELSTTKHDSSTVLKFSFNLGKKEDHGDENQDREHSSVKWMSSKMRFMRRMMNSDAMNGAEKPTQVSQNHGDQNQRLSHSESLNNNSNNNDGINVRVCSDCNTTKTPLWRSGPRGPKSLCNACGIRQRKARRAMAAAAAAVENGTSSPTANLPSVKCKNKKRGKVGATAAAPSRSKKKLQFDDFALSLSENSAFYHPQDEKEAAILLMALSCGLVHG